MTNNPDNYLNKLCLQILAVLKDTDRPMGTAALVAELGQAHDAVQSAVCKLIVRDAIIMVGRCHNDRPIYRPRAN